MYETVHNWPRLGFSAGGPTPEELADGWFNEGIAEYYSLILPYRFGIFSEQDFIRRLNIRISGYYTNPDRAVTNKDVQDRFWKGGHVNRIPYQRGFMYFMKLAYQLKKRKARSLDELILRMVDLRKRKGPHGIAVWNSILEVELGPHALIDYYAVSEAVPIVLHPDCLHVTENLNLTLQEEEQEEFYLGFPESRFNTKPAMVKDLDPQSRAAEAGVCEGDMITTQYGFFFIAERWGRNFEMTVRRRAGTGSDEQKTLSWPPRSREKVESYQLVPKT
jgi:predicted metalloprotease with PDZ domain